MAGLSRRELLRVLGGFSAALAGGTSVAGERPSEAVDESAKMDAFLAQFYREPTKADLPVPDDRPAIALTDEGWYEYGPTRDDWTPVPLGSRENPLPPAHFTSLETQDISVKPVKIGLLADVHYPGNGTNIGASGMKETNRKLARFVQDMNEWEADHVFFMGDTTVEWGTRTKSRNKIGDFRDLVEDNLDMETHQMWGNHEYGNADEWGSDWSYGPWGISRDSQTWYTVETQWATVIVLNNGYSETGHVDTKFPQAEIDWLEQELRTTSGPIIVLSHLPLSIGTGQAYDHAENEEQVAQLLGRHGNVVCCLFGHCHHDANVRVGETSPEPYFDQLREQRAYGLRHIFVPWIQHLQNDTAYTPYGMLSVYPNGTVRLEMPYSETGTREVCSITAGARAVQFNEDEYLRNPNERLSWESHFDSIDGFGTETRGGGTMDLHERGVTLATEAGDGGAATIRKVREFASVDDPVTGGWTNCLWRCYVKFGNVDESEIDLLWGDPETNYVGFRISEGVVNGVREDGSGEVETPAQGTVERGENVLFTLYYAPDLSRIAFMLGERGARPKMGLSPGSPEPAGSGHVLYARIRNGASTEQALQIGWVSIEKRPDLMIRQ